MLELRRRRGRRWNNISGRDWIMARVIGTTWCRGFAGLPVAALWKYVAFIGGPIALDVMIAVTTDGPLPSYVREWCATHPTIKERRIRFLATLLAKALTADSDEVREQLLRAYNQMRRLDQQTTGTLDEPPSPIRMMDNVFRLIRGSRKPRRKTQPKQGKIGNQSSGSKTATRTKQNEPVASFLNLLK